MVLLRFSFIIIWIFVKSTIISGQDFQINDFGGMGTSFGVDSVNLGDVIRFTPTGEVNGLDFQHINQALEAQDVIIETVSGDIKFAPGLFVPGRSGRKLSIKAGGNIHLSFGHGARQKINLELNAGKDVVIDGSGINTYGGEFHSSGRNINIQNQGLITAGGQVILDHTGRIDISGTGVKTGGGAFQSSGADLNLEHDGIQTNGGDATFCHIGNVTINGSGIVTSHGDFIGEGNDIHLENGGINTGYGYCTLNMTGDIIIAGGGVNARGYSSCGKDLIIVNYGIRTLGDYVILQHWGDVTVLGQGIRTQGGHVISSGNNLIVGGEVNTGGEGIQTSNGSVTIEHEGDITVRANGMYSGTGSISIFSDGGTVHVSRGGVSTENADIAVHSAGGKLILEGFNVNSNVGKKKGQGILDTSQINPGSLVLHTEPVLGGGNITLKTTK